MGWDATGSSLAPSGSGAVHHPLGDLKKAATSKAPLSKEKWKFSEKTHLKVLWGNKGGGTLDGSSGAALVDRENNLILGVLSGGVTAVTCSGNHDFFGSLEHAWDRGLKDILKPDAAQKGRRVGVFGRRASAAAAAAERSMPGREYIIASDKDIPHLIITPPRLIVAESAQPENIAQVALSEAPKSGETVQVHVTLKQFPTPVANPEFPTQPPISLVTDTLTFTATDWDTAQNVVAIPGADTLAQGPLPFRLEFKSSLENSNSHDGTAAAAAPTTSLVEQRVVQGLRTDEELVPGYSIEDPIVLNRDPELGMSIEGRGILEPQGGRNQAKGKLIKLGDPLSEQVNTMPLGSATYFNLTLSKEGVFDIKVCSKEMELQLAVYFNQTATW
jgi:hypothetical protein